MERLELESLAVSTATVLIVIVGLVALLYLVGG